MPYEVLTEEPTELVGGDTWTWRKAVSEFPASAGWQLAYRLAGESDLAIAWGTHVSADGDGFLVLVPAASTGKPAGTYVLTGFVTKGSERYTLLDADGRPLEVVVTVLANPATAVNAKSHDETVLALINAALEGRLSADQEEFQINGRSVKHIPIEELIKLQGQYRARIIAARNPSAAFRQIEVGFVQPR